MFTHLKRIFTTCIVSWKPYSGQVRPYCPPGRANYAPYFICFDEIGWRGPRSTNNLRMSFEVWSNVSVNVDNDVHWVSVRRGARRAGWVAGVVLRRAPGVCFLCGSLCAIYGPPGVRPRRAILTLIPAAQGPHPRAGRSVINSLQMFSYKSSLSRDRDCIL